MSIIVLLILAGITINLTLGKNGLINNSQKVIEAYKIEAAKEKISLAISTFETDKQNLILVEELDKIETLTSIITLKDNNLPYFVIVDGYEFTINENLSINYIGKSDETNKEDGNVFISISNQNVVENHVLITLNGKTQNVPIKQIDLYINGIKEKTYVYRDNQLEKEETYLLNNMEFYKDIEYYAVITNNNGTTAISESKKVKNIDTIANHNDLKKLASLVNEGITFKDETINLISDISVGENWIPIGYYDAIESWHGKYFSGTFNGNNHTVTINSLSKDELYKNNGLFGMVIGGTINNIILNGVIDAESSYTGRIVGAIHSGTISNCTNNSNNTNTSFINHGRNSWMC